MTPAEVIQEQILTLKAALTAASPTMPTLLRTIHQNLQKDKDIVTLLTPIEVGIIVNGLMKQTNVVIATKATSKKKLKDISLDDL